MKKVIFLDIDGVLCTDKAAMAFEGSDKGPMRHLDPTNVKLIERLCQNTRTEIVLTSTWRIQFDKHTMEIILRNAGFAFVPWHQAWKTPNLKNSSRGEEVRAWMTFNGTPEQYVIIDDVDEFDGELKDHLVLTTEEEGLTYADYKKALSLLKQ